MARLKNMMLSTKYVKDWTAAEALREIVANAVDADPDYTVEFDDDGDSVVIATKTLPTVTQLILMGAGSKDSDGSTIGQFGEGVKLAALALTRGRHNLTIDIPSKRITFAIHKDADLDEPTLWAEFNHAPHNTTDGCVIGFHAAGIREVFAKFFLPRDQCGQFGPIAKEKGKKGTRIYCQGILVKRIEDRSIYDWNLPSVRLNRDRNIPDMYSVRCGIRRILDDRIQGEDGERLARLILSNTDSLESISWNTAYPSDAAARVFASAFQNQFGTNAVLSSGNGPHNALAAARGHEIVALPADLQDVVRQTGVVQRASDVVLKSDQLTQVSSAPFGTEIAELREVLDVVGCGSQAILVFTDDGKTLGCYDRNGIWLSEQLFQPGQRFERLRTMLHEIGHHRGGGDMTETFEASLDYIAAKAVEKLLDERAARR